MVESLKVFPEESPKKIMEVSRKGFPDEFQNLNFELNRNNHGELTKFLKHPNR